MLNVLVVATVWGLSCPCFSLLPGNIQDPEYDGGNRCSFRPSLGLQAAFVQPGCQRCATGFRETRRPIVSTDRRYTEFAKDATKVSVSVFSHEVGSRIILGYEGMRSTVQGSAWCLREGPFPADPNARHEQE